MLATCNGCDAVAPEADDNEMGYCAGCLADATRKTEAMGDDACR